ncbi:MAG TPA: VOC family protein [Bryobacteraceae bacterium]|nr:VOC family protein [Bryobacteraceae bacterium]
MIQNRSAPPGPIVPRLIYKDVAKAIDWLTAAFGFTERLRTPPEPDGTIHHAQLAIGAGSVILTGQPVQRPDEFIQALTVPVENIDEHCARARHFGARILSPPDTKPFGERQYAAEDLEGRRWVFTESLSDVQPEAWGATVHDIKHRLELLPRPRLCYLQIPAVDVRQSAVFYEKVFGWNIRRRDSDHPSFDDATGNVSGAWLTGRAIARDPGLLPYVWVDDIDATLALAEAHGGEIVEAPHRDAPDSTSWIATFRDPAGNLIGLYRERPI